MQQNFIGDYFRPRELEVESLGQNLSKIILGPFERGVGYTLGNSLRRIMLSALPGAAITEVSIDGVLHEYSSLSGVREDVVDILLNIKGLVFALDAGISDVQIKLNVSRSGVVSGSDLHLPVGVSLLNPDHVLAHLSEGVGLVMSMRLESGFGYRPASSSVNTATELGVGRLFLDAYFSPVVKVSYSVEPMRVGQRTDLDRLSLVIQTNGSVLPESAVVAASSRAVEYFSIFSALGTSPDVVKVVSQAQPLPSELLPQSPSSMSQMNSSSDGDSGFDSEILKMSIDELDLTSRASNCLKADRIFFVSDLVKKTEQELLRMPNLGRKSLNEIKEALEKRSLTLA
jgi:DNA-directed RNA polymerase subunit alpha